MGKVLTIWARGDRVRKTFPFAVITGLGDGFAEGLEHLVGVSMTILCWLRDGSRGRLRYILFSFRQEHCMPAHGRFGCIALNCIAG